MHSPLKLFSPELSERAWSDTRARLSAWLRFRRYWQSWLPVMSVMLVLFVVILVIAVSGVFRQAGVYVREGGDEPAGVSAWLASERMRVLVAFLLFWLAVIGGALIPQVRPRWRRVAFVVAVLALGVLVGAGWWFCPEEGNSRRQRSAGSGISTGGRMVPTLADAIRAGAPTVASMSKDERELNKRMQSGEPVSTGGGHEEGKAMLDKLRDDIEVKTQAARIAWTATTFVVILSGGVLIFASVWVIVRSMDAGWALLIRGRTLVALGLLIGGVLCWTQRYDFQWGPPILQDLLDAVFDGTRKHLASAKVLTQAMNGVALGSICLVTLAVCSILSASADPHKRDAPLLSVQMRRQQVLLYLSAAALTLGAREIAVLYSWPAAWFQESLAKDIERLAAAAATAGGVFFSATLLAIFVPAELVLAARAREIATKQLAKMGKRTPSAKEIQDWLTDQGLIGVDFKSVPVIGAILGPVLASGPLSVMLKSVGG